MKLFDWLRPFLAPIEIDFRKADQFIHTEEKDIEAVITDALNALSAAKDAVLAKIANDANALATAQGAVTQAEADRDQAKADLATAQQQLADAEAQITAITAQLNPPAA